MVIPVVFCPAAAAAAAAAAGGGGAGGGAGGGVAKAEQAKESVLGVLQVCANRVECFSKTGLIKTTARTPITSEKKVAGRMPGRGRKRGSRSLAKRFVQWSCRRCV